MWVTQSPLLQLPSFDQDTIDLLKKAKVEDIVDFMNMDDDLRHKTLKLNPNQLENLARVCMRYPNVEMEFKCDLEEYAEGALAEVEVIVRRPDFEEDEELAVFNQPPYT